MSSNISRYVIEIFEVYGRKFLTEEDAVDFKDRYEPKMNAKYVTVLSKPEYDESGELHYKDVYRFAFKNVPLVDTIINYFLIQTLKSPLGNLNGDMVEMWTVQESTTVDTFQELVDYADTKVIVGKERKPVTPAIKFIEVELDTDGSKIKVRTTDTLTLKELLEEPKAELI